MGMINRSGVGGGPNVLSNGGQEFVAPYSEIIPTAVVERVAPTELGREILANCQAVQAEIGSDMVRLGVQRRICLERCDIGNAKAQETADGLLADADSERAKALAEAQRIFDEAQRHISEGYKARVDEITRNLRREIAKNEELRTLMEAYHAAGTEALNVLAEDNGRIYDVATAVDGRDMEITEAATNNEAARAEYMAKMSDQTDRLTTETATQQARRFELELAEQKRIAMLAALKQKQNDARQTMDSDAEMPDPVKDPDGYNQWQQLILQANGFLIGAQNEDVNELTRQQDRIEAIEAGVQRQSDILGELDAAITATRADIAACDDIDGRLQLGLTMLEQKRRKLLDLQKNIIEILDQWSTVVGGDGLSRLDYMSDYLTQFLKKTKELQAAEMSRGIIPKPSVSLAVLKSDPAALTGIFDAQDGGGVPDFHVEYSGLGADKAPITTDDLPTVGMLLAGANQDGSDGAHQSLDQPQIKIDSTEAATGDRLATLLAHLEHAAEVPTVDRSRKH